MLFSEGKDNYYQVSDLCKLTRKYIIHTIPDTKRYLDGNTWFVHVSEVPSLVKKAKETGIHSTIDYSVLPDLVKQTIDFVIFNKKKQIQQPTDHTALHLTSDAPEFILDAVWKAIVRNCHPDTGGNSDTFLRYKAAYESIKKRYPRRS